MNAWIFEQEMNCVRRGTYMQHGGRSVVAFDADWNSSSRSAVKCPIESDSRSEIRFVSMKTMKKDGHSSTIVSLAAVDRAIQVDRC